MTRFEEFDRRSGLGASEVPAILGQSPWASPVAVWLDKVGMAGPRSSVAMRVGLALERAVLGIGADLGGTRYVRNRQTLRHPRWPAVPLFATPDGFGPRRDTLAEVKVVGFRGSDWTGGPPPYVLTQCHAQLAVLPRASRVVVVALIGSDVRTFEVARDPAIVEAIETDVATFWSTYVVPEVAPPAETNDDRWSVVRAFAARAGDRGDRAAESWEGETAARLLDLRAEIARLGDDESALRLDLAEAARDADIVGDGWRATWDERRHTDWSAVAREVGASPEVVARFTTTNRVFALRRTRVEELTA